MNDIVCGLCRDTGAQYYLNKAESILETFCAGCAFFIRVNSTDWEFLTPEEAEAFRIMTE